MNGNALLRCTEAKNFLFVRVHVQQYEYLRAMNRKNCNEKMNFFSLCDEYSDDDDDNYENEAHGNKSNNYLVYAHEDGNAHRIMIRDDVVHEIRIDGIPDNDEHQYLLNNSKDTLHGDKKEKRPANFVGGDTFPDGLNTTSDEAQLQQCNSLKELHDEVNRGMICLLGENLPSKDKKRF